MYLHRTKIVFQILISLQLTVSDRFLIVNCQHDSIGSRHIKLV